MATAQQMPNSPEILPHNFDIPAGEVALAPIDRDLRLWRKPEEVLVEAQEAAAALQQRIAGKAKKVVFNGEQYIEADDWQMVAHFFGYSVKATSCDFVEFGDVVGFKAEADLVHEATGRIVSHAVAFCLNEEDNWGERNKYDYQNGRRVCVGTVSTPRFQLASMAQTRACAKACRNKLAWVVALAGYRPTPAEEMRTASGQEIAGRGPSSSPSNNANRIPNERILQLCGKISRATTVSELKTVYFAAYREAQQINDKTAMNAYQKSAEARKSGIEKAGKR